jgi:anti-sigma B factor antagonist
MAEPSQKEFVMSSQPKRQRLQVEDYGEVSVVNFVDKRILDEQNIQEIGKDLFSLVENLGRKKILLNFGNVELLSSAALGKLLTLHKKVKTAGGKLTLCNINEDLYEVFEITKFNKLLDIQKDEQTALQTF